MMRNVLSSIDGVAVWAVAALLVLFVFFVVMIWRVIRMPSSQVREMKGIPLKNDDD